MEIIVENNLEKGMLNNTLMSEQFNEILNEISYLNDEIDIIFSENIKYLDISKLADISIQDKIKTMTFLGLLETPNCFFRKFKNLELVNLPKVLNVLPCTFVYCDNLKTVNFKEVEQIGYMAFSGCKKLEKITGLDNLLKIEQNAFNDTGLKQITIPIKHLPESCFEGCFQLKEVTGSFETIGNNCFRDCSNLKSITNMELIKQIGNYAFYNTNLDCISLNNDVVIGNRSFSKCRQLKVSQKQEYELVKNGLECCNLRESTILKLLKEEVENLKEEVTNLKFLELELEQKQKNLKKQIKLKENKIKQCNKKINKNL